eukprot:gene1620-12700_t
MSWQQLHPPINMVAKSSSAKSSPKGKAAAAKPNKTATKRDKPAVKKECPIHNDVVVLMNAQIKMEQFAASSYLAKASWCKENGFDNSADFFYAQAEEEREHMLKISKFLSNNGATATSPSVGSVDHSFDSLQETFEKALEQEQDVTKAIHKLFKKARQEEDLVSELFLQFFVKEQAAEEQQFKNILQMIELMEDAPLQLIDEKIKRA